MGRPNQRKPKAQASSALHDLERGRDCYARRAWDNAYQAFLLADQAEPLAAGDLELLAMSACLTGRDHEYLRILERAHQALLEAEERQRAIRCAFWLGFRLFLRGESGRATGWLARAQRLLEREAEECAERGYLMLTEVEHLLDAGEHDTAHAKATTAVEIGERCEDVDLVACARHQQGRIRLRQGQIAAGLSLLDEVMVAVAAGELSPLVTGMMYCSIIMACQEVYAVGRAREWTAALSRWCDEQPEIVAFTGVCRVHRAEIMQLGGAWQDAIDEARRALDVSLDSDRPTAAAAAYQEAEVHRLRGEFAAAEAAYRSANEGGLEPQPGLALLRLAQGRIDAGAAAIRRAVGVPGNPLRRTKLLPAYIEIMLAAGDIAAARSACHELQEIVRDFDTDVLRAMVAEAQGAVELAEGSPQAALGTLRDALDVWQRVEAPHAAARVRMLIGLACRAVGDEDGAQLELGAARSVFQQLGAAPDVARIDAPQAAATTNHPHGLTARELQVLRLIATGKTNKAIGAELCLSERTIDRHVSNIFTKLDVPSRAAATALAYEQKLF
jgi:DNA-binding CsgD family transcriptional regulator